MNYSNISITPIVKIIGSIVILIFTSSSVFASGGTPIDQYKQMGGFAAIAEVCYLSKAIPEKLNLLVKRTVNNNPSTSDTMKSLVSVYNDAYKKAILDQQVWNGTASNYSKPLNCIKDKGLVMQFEENILENLK